MCCGGANGEPMVFYNPVNEVWGPAMWSYLHNFAVETSPTLFLASPPLASPPLASLVDMLAHLDILIPCIKCQFHYRALLTRVPLPTLPSFANVQAWLYTIHNEINASTGKGAFAYTVQTERVVIPPTVWEVLDAELQRGMNRQIKDIESYTKYIEIFKAFKDQDAAVLP